jgi:heme-degrading monooxygenase HmoA
MTGLAHHIAQLNIGVLTHPRDHAEVAEFVNNVPRVNGLAERSKGFIWRCVDEQAAIKAEGINFFDGDPRATFTLSVWETLAEFEAFVQRTIHGGFLRRRENWFTPLGTKTYVIWRVPIGHIPKLGEALAKLEHLRRNGASEEAFDFEYIEQEKLI